MNKEIRIYYESYEQANHYIKPIIRQNFSGTDIKLVYLSKGNGYVDGSLISKILKLKNPDIMISYVLDEVEIPIFVIEFSEAVTTEDHELQRFDGYLGAVAGKCFYIKISPQKKSQSQHGGNINFNILEPYALIYKRFNLLSFHFEWPLDTPVFVKRDADYFSCPPKIEALEFLITETIKNILSNFSEIKEKGLGAIPFDKFEGNKEIKKWVENLKGFEFEDNCAKFNSSRLKWILRDKAFLFKFNRMGHAMDPERGMIWYYKHRYNKPIISRIIFPSAGDAVFLNKRLKTEEDYLRAFVAGTGLDKGGNFVRFLKKRGYITDSKLNKKVIDISEFLKSNLSVLNKQLFAIFSNSEKMLIQDKTGKNRITLFWNSKLDIFSAETNTQVTLIKKRDFIEEDDITYIVAHHVLKKNGFQIISLSYPGAQGDRAILPQAGSGRGQERKYIDIVACYPKKYIDLTENKGTYNLPEVTKDIKKLNFYRSNVDFKNALAGLIKKISPGNEGLPILLSVGFWVSNKKANLKGIPINKINFFITVSPDIKEWKVWTGGNLDIFKYKEGLVDLSETYYIPCKKLIEK